MNTALHPFQTPEWIAFRYIKPWMTGDDVDDLFQLIRIGSWEAAETFAPVYGCSFSAHFNLTVHRYVGSRLSQCGGMTRHRWAHVNSRRDELVALLEVELEGGPLPTPEDLLLEKERSKVLRQAVDNLCELDRRRYRLSFSD